MPTQQNVQVSGTVTRKANGAIEFTPTDAGTYAKLPAMGDEVTLDITVDRTAAEIEREVAASKAERAAAAPAAATDVTEVTEVTGASRAAPATRTAIRRKP